MNMAKKIKANFEIMFIILFFFIVFLYKRDSSIKIIFSLKQLLCMYIYKEDLSIGLLICTLISENQGFEKSRSASNLRKKSGPANLDFFSDL